MDIGNSVVKTRGRVGAGLRGAEERKWGTSLIASKIKETDK